MDCMVLWCFGGLDDLRISMDLIMVFQLTERYGCFSWLGQFGCISWLWDLGVSMGWLICVFQWAVCVWLLLGDSVDWWLCGVQRPVWI